MRTLLLFLSAPLLLAACQMSPPAPANNCTNQHGAQPINIHYGDSQLKVTPPLYKVHKNKFLKFKLIADNVAGPGGLDYGAVTVTVRSKDSKTNQWINTSGSENKGAVLTVCMPADQPLGVVEYLVDVDKVGTLDPRAEVIP